MMARASRRSLSMAGTPTPMKAARSGGWRNCCRASTARWPSSRAGSATRWRDTVVVVATEFGRTARINGTEGTDHGTGTVALLAGGAVKGGRVIADWPGTEAGEPLREPRPRADHRSARGDQGRAVRSSRHRRTGAGRDCVSGQRRGETDEGIAGLDLRLGGIPHRCDHAGNMARCAAMTACASAGKVCYQGARLGCRRLTCTSP